MDEIIKKLVLSLDYGSVFERSEFREILGIKCPTLATYQEHQKSELEELQAASKIRDQLLQTGKYLKKDGDVYRVLLPSENADQVKRMNESADRKYRRAQILSNMTPKESLLTTHHTSVFSRLKDIARSVKRHNLLA